jgi:hypothetical protein
VTRKLTPGVLYSIKLDGLYLRAPNGSEFNAASTLASGRTNYLLFEDLVRDLTGLVKTIHSDHRDSLGCPHEQKAYEDPELYPRSRDWFETGASCTGHGNGHDDEIKDLLARGKYAAALKICNETGYSNNDFYVYTNTRGYRPSVPFRFFIAPTAEVRRNLSKKDPRLVSLSGLMQGITKRSTLRSF